MEVNFDLAFHALTGNQPLRWQRRLFHRIVVDGDIPPLCDLTTGLGKTSIVPIWLIALASQLEKSNKNTLPRRLAYIVNRRIVVDQATTLVESIRKRLVGHVIVSKRSNTSRMMLAYSYVGELKGGL